MDKNSKIVAGKALCVQKIDQTGHFGLFLHSISSPSFRSNPNHLFSNRWLRLSKKVVSFFLFFSFLDQLCGGGTHTRTDGGVRKNDLHTHSKTLLNTLRSMKCGQSLLFWETKLGSGREAAEKRGRIESTGNWTMLCPLICRLCSPFVFFFFKVDSQDNRVQKKTHNDSCCCYC